MTRETSLIHAELYDAIRELASVFDDKVQMELERADWFRSQADAMEGGEKFGPQLVQAAGVFHQRMVMLDMRQQEMWLKVQRLTMEAAQRAQETYGKEQA